MNYLLYNMALTLAAPPAAIWLRLNPRHRTLLERFHPPLPAGTQGAICVHACSVGEVLTAKLLINKMRARWPHSSILLTASTVSGFDLARQTMPETPATFFPFDHPLIVRDFLTRLQPKALLLVETELWPNVLRHAALHHVPVFMVNGRISDKHFARNLKIRAFMGRMLRAVTIACMQNQEYAERIARLGMDPERIRVTGNTKFDGVPTTINEDVLDQLRREMDIEPDHKIITFGSTRPGDEALAWECWKTLREEFPSLRMVIAPRHRDRLAEALACIHEPFRLRSKALAGQPAAGERVIVVDTVGELVNFYALSDIVVIGGSFYPGVNGHNPLESAALSVPTVFGPYMRNFIDPARELVKCQGALQVAESAQLPPVLRTLMHDPSWRTQMAARGRDAVMANQGAVDKTLDFIQNAVPSLA